MTDPTPKQGDEVWLVRVAAELPACTLAEATRLLDDSERSRATKFISVDARQQFIAARCVLRHMLSRFVPVRPEAWTFSAGPHGKPFVAGPASARKALHFNLSHTSGLIACAISTHGQIGIDVERVRTFADGYVPLLLMSSDEKRELAAIQGVEHDRRFFAIWTAKEAYAKACGKGISDALRNVTVCDAGGQSHLVGLPANSSLWRIHRLDAGYGHAAALATESVYPPTISRLTIDDVLKSND